MPALTPPVTRTRPSARGTAAKSARGLLRLATIDQVAVDGSHVSVATLSSRTQSSQLQPRECRWQASLPTTSVLPSASGTACGENRPVAIVPAVSQWPTTAGVELAVGSGVAPVAVAVGEADRRSGDALDVGDGVGDGVVDAPQDATMIAIAATQANLARIVVLPGRLRRGADRPPWRAPAGLRPSVTLRSCPLRRCAPAPCCARGVRHEDGP